MDENIKLENLIEKKFKNISLETKIISYILKQDHKVAFLLDEDTFTIEAYQFILNIVKKNKMEYPKSILWQTLKPDLEDDDFDIYKTLLMRIYKADLTNITSKNIEKLCNKLLELQHSRRLMNAISDVVTNIPKFKLEDVKFKLQNVLLNADIKTRSSIDYVGDFERRRDHLKEVAADPKNMGGIPTGIEEFDEMSGGLMRKEFGVVVAHTGFGKSIKLGNLAMNAYYRNYNAVIATFEMTNREYAYRLDSRNARIEFSKFRKAELNIFDYERWEQKILKFKERKKNFLRIVSFPRNSTFSDIESELYKIQDQEKQKVDLLLVDYINLIAPTSTGNIKDWKSQTDVIWEMKELCQNFNDSLGLAGWTANQLTDEGSKAKKITTNHMKYARGISEAAPVIIALSQGENAKIENLIEMWVIKCRNFEKQSKPIILYPNFKYMIMNDPSRIREK